MVLIHTDWCQGYARVRDRFEICVFGDRLDRIWKLVSDSNVVMSTSLIVRCVFTYVHEQFRGNYIDVVFLKVRFFFIIIFVLFFVPDLISVWTSVMK